MHDLQTIRKYNAPLSQASPEALKKAYEIQIEARNSEKYTARATHCFYCDNSGCRRCSKTGGESP